MRRTYLGAGRCCDLFAMERRHQLVLIIVAALILFGAGHKYAQVKAVEQARSQNPLVDIDEGPKSAADQAGEQMDAGDGENRKPVEVVVHVAGEVERPGVYRLPPGSRVVDAVQMAGPTENSALDHLNLAAPLHDGSRILVLNFNMDHINSPADRTGAAGAIGGPQPSPPAGLSGATGLININTAGQAELEKLPGIGPALAGRIIEHRSKHGRFLSPEDLMSVSGIGDKKLEQVRDLICVH